MHPAPKGCADRVDLFRRLRPELRAYVEADRADKNVRRDARRMRRLLAVTIAYKAERYASRGLPPKLALTRCALSAEQLRHDYQRDHGGPLPAKSTIQGHLKALFAGHCADVLPARWDERRQVMLSPGYTYDLRVLALTLGRHGRGLLTWLRRQLHTYTHNRFSGSKHIGPTSDRERMERRARGALEWAISAAEGRRNNVGFRLAALCRDIGLDQIEVERVLESYQEAVEWSGAHPYTRREALSTVRCAFRRPARGWSFA